MSGEPATLFYQSRLETHQRSVADSLRQHHFSPTLLFPAG